MTLTFTLGNLAATALLIYVIGALVGLVFTDGSLLTRVGFALVWPLGPLAFAATVTFLLGVAGVAFPLFGVVLLVAIAAVAWATLG